MNEIARPTKEQIAAIARTAAGRRRVRKLQEAIQRERDHLQRRLEKYARIPYLPEAAAERARVIEEVEGLRSVCDGVLADCAEVLGEVPA